MVLVVFSAPILCRRRLAPTPSEDDWARLEDDEGLVNDALLDIEGLGFRVLEFSVLRS